MRIRTSILWIASGLLLPCYLQAATGFRGIGFLSPSNPYSEVRGVSPDGRWLVGEVQTSTGVTAFRMPVDGSITPINTGFANSTAEDVSDNGTVAGYSLDSTLDQRPFRFTDSGGAVPLAGIGSGTAQGISRDGSVVVGSYANANAITEAYRWTEATAAQGLGNLIPGPFSSLANGVSGNGLTVVGVATGSAAPISSVAFRWTSAAGMQDLGDVPGGDLTATAIATNADGSVIVGAGSATGGIRAFRWTASTGVQSIGVPTGKDTSTARDCTDDGNVIVGNANIAGLPGSSDAFIWSAGLGPRDFELYLSEQYGLQLPSWRLTNALVSGDGLVFAGTGVNPQGQPEGWVFVVPEPNCFGLLTGVLVTLRARRG